ncbi:MAG: prenyltransferase/squalene oxidase repeat-containing protein [Planctomycetota bacterium]|jgi:hypothetical protein
MSGRPVATWRTAAAAAAAALLLACSGALAGEAPGREVTALFEHFREWVAKGELDSARRGMERAARDRRFEAHAGTFRSLAAVARSLEERRAVVKKGSEALVDQEVELKTSRGVRKGTVAAVTGEGVEVRSKITMRGKVIGESRIRVKWPDLDPEEEGRFAKGWDPVGDEGALARALVALSRGDEEEAGSQLRSAGTHPFAEYLRGELGAGERPAAGAGRKETASSAVSGPLGRGDLYGYRTGEDRLKAALKFGGSEASETAVDRALAWLAGAQEPDGRWSIARWGGNKDEEACVGLTGLSLLAFLSAGHTEKAGAHRRTVLKAVAYLISRQGMDGAIGPNRSNTTGGGYNHAIAGLALAEAFGMARVRRTGVAVQRAVGYAIDVHMYRDGGWRYAPGMSPCTSVTGWFFMFLNSAKTARIKVDPKGFLGAKAWFDKVTNMPGRGKGAAGLGLYMPGSTPRRTMTAVVMLARLLMGKERTDPLVKGAADYLMTPTAHESWPYYGPYYASMAMFQMGGSHWEKWNASHRDMFISKQVSPDDKKLGGSWEPVGGGSRGGRVYSTAMACLCLEVYYRYKRK